MSAEQAVYTASVADVTDPESVLLPGHDVPLGRYTTVRRLLPLRQRRMIGAWCFVDHFGPDDVAGRPGMQVPPHPHTGTANRHLARRRHRRAPRQPGQPPVDRARTAQLMTAGRGIAHSEYTPPEHPPSMHGLQLWIALPDDVRNDPPRFEHHPHLPVHQHGERHDHRRRRGVRRHSIPGPSTQSTRCGTGPVRRRRRPPPAGRSRLRTRRCGHVGCSHGRRH